ncbi:2Fe-2S ferredoxin [Xanthobacter flavus]|uniref:Ferredoxin n=1 Tax=Xanthobacter flavus TaxID=281 RepID=A0A9W6CQ36_XANFL|nr:2Fe-2S iron-sulfur cluster-binding protein [Xanthobacter flavus]MDR6335102.1 2Fe-2S ferredoxin [Xanthobacter flavus]GLI23675.1 ferredoxin [Xanthobacter flavus]
MSSLIVTLRSGEMREIAGIPGLSLKEVLLAGGIDEVHGLTNCGGCCSCGTCHVVLDPVSADRVAPPEDTEVDLLEIVEDRQSTSRLACQVPFTEELDGLKVRIGPER